MKKQITSVVLASMILVGCSNRQAHTISEYQPGDSVKSCNALGMEISNLETDMNRKWSEKNKQTGTNVALGVAGAFLIVPWFFMDLSGAEKTEYESYKRRYDSLKIVLADKDCKTELDSIAQKVKKSKAEEKLKKENGETNTPADS